MTTPETSPPPLPSEPVPSIWLHALIGAAIVGGVGFIGGFFGPIIFSPQSNQGPLLGIFITGPAGCLLGFVGGAITGICRSWGKREAQSATEPLGSPAAVLGLASMLGFLAVLACGIPFIPPLLVVTLPLAGLSLFLMARVIFRATRWTPGRAISAVLALGLDGFALFLALGHHHLIDWLEGH